MTETSFGFDCIGAAPRIWGGTFNYFCPKCGAYFRAALNRGGAYSSKCGILPENFVCSLETKTETRRPRVP